MSYESEVKAVLSADGTLTGYLTGGIYTYAQTGRKGITEGNPAAAWDSDKKLKPCCVVKQRSRVPTAAIKDEGLQTTSERAVIEIWFYDDGAASTTAIENAISRVYTLLHDKRTTNARIMWILGIINDREDELQNAHRWRSDYEAIGIRS